MVHESLQLVLVAFQFRILCNKLQLDIVLGITWSGVSIIVSILVAIWVT